MLSSYQNNYENNMLNSSKSNTTFDSYMYPSVFLVSNDYQLTCGNINPTPTGLPDVTGTIPAVTGTGTMATGTVATGTMATGTMATGTANFTDLTNDYTTGTIIPVWQSR